MQKIYRIELFALGLGLLGGLCTGIFDYIILANAHIPAVQLNFDFIYPLFFLLAFFAYLVQNKNLVARPIIFGTTFFILANFAGFIGVFVATDEAKYLPRFQLLFPGQDFASAMLEIAVNRLSWCFVAMLLALGVGAVQRIKARRT